MFLWHSTDLRYKTANWYDVWSTVVCILVRMKSFPRFWRNHPYCRNRWYLIWTRAACFHWDEAKKKNQNGRLKKRSFPAPPILHIFSWIFILPFFLAFSKIWGVVYFCNMDDFFRILEKRLSELICTRLYLQRNYHRNKLYGLHFWPQLSGDRFGWKADLGP